MCFWNGRRPRLDVLARHTSDAAWNDTHWKNDRFDQLVASARAELDEPSGRVYSELQTIVRDDGAIIPMYACRSLEEGGSAISLPQRLSGRLEGGRRWWMA
jgi:peptide/nickel transport system substrate-binding protein